MEVRDVMTTDVVTAAPSMSVGDLADMLVRRRLRAVPVIDEEGTILGMVTDHQVMLHLLPMLDEDRSVARAVGPSMKMGEVRDVMERAVLCVNETEPLADVIRLMLDKEIERLPVVRNGQLVGFITRGDIIRRLLREEEGSKQA
jgi:CBS domain-containing protein